jgi:rhodanese-related sulfurtransferase
MSALKELVKNPATAVVDVRSSPEYEMEHIHGAKLFRWKK